jgi:hypothetical protein
VPLGHPSSFNKALVGGLVEGEWKIYLNQWLQILSNLFHL